MKIAALIAGAGMILAGIVGAAFQDLVERDHDCGGQVRTYYVEAQDTEWDYAPLGYNGITDRPFEMFALPYVVADEHRIGRVYQKAVYREYTDGSFTQLSPRPEHLGILGPVLRAEVGDTIQVVLRNTASIPVTLHAHGVAYDQADEGATHGALHESVPPGATKLYTWTVPERAGPGTGEDSSRVWLYHSHADEPRDTNAGLVGPLVITGCGKAKEDATPKDVDRELFTYFTAINENDSPYLEENIRRYLRIRDDVDRADEGFIESNLKHAINGYLFGNLPGLETEKGERVRWYVLALGSEADLHTAHWHGNTLDAMGAGTDVVELLPATTRTLDMVPDMPGHWLLHCHVNDHLDAGMAAIYQVR
jgi:manganese oxidase